MLPRIGIAGFMILLILTNVGDPSIPGPFSLTSQHNRPARLLVSCSSRTTQNGPSLQLSRARGSGSRSLGVEGVWPSLRLLWPQELAESANTTSYGLHLWQLLAELGNMIYWCLKHYRIELKENNFATQHPPEVP